MKKLRKGIVVIFAVATLLGASALSAEAWSAWTTVRATVSGGTLQGQWRSRITGTRVEAQGVGLNPSSSVNASRASQIRVVSFSRRYNASGTRLLNRENAGIWRGQGQGQSTSGVDRVSISGTQRRQEGNLSGLRIR